MKAHFDRHGSLLEELEALALAGDLDVACLLGVIEAWHAPVTNLDANPEAAMVYWAARAVELRRLDEEWDELVDRVGAALL